MFLLCLFLHFFLNFFLRTKNSFSPCLSLNYFVSCDRSLISKCVFISRSGSSSNMTIPRVHGTSYSIIFRTHSLSVRKASSNYSKRFSVSICLTDFIPVLAIFLLLLFYKKSFQSLLRIFRIIL